MGRNRFNEASVIDLLILVQQQKAAAVTRECRQACGACGRWPAAGDEAATICRNIHGFRLAGWFDHATAVLVGRTNAPDNPTLTQREAVLDALAPVDLPVIFDLEIGHVPPHMPLVNGALASVTVNAETRQIVQELR
jgi:hypothetical protein